MQKRINWNPGMRISDKHLRASDDAHYAWIDEAITLAAAGQFGLIPNHKPFKIEWKVNGEYVDITALTCLAVTEGHDLIDIEFDSKYSIPNKNRTKLLKVEPSVKQLLIIKATKQWEKTNVSPKEMVSYEELAYEFEIINANSRLPENAFPVDRLVASSNGWVSDCDFVPPCLFVSAHEKYKNLLSQFLDILKQIELKTQPLPDSDALRIMTVLLPFIQQIRIDSDWGQDTLTPLGLLANIQKIAGTFYTVSVLNDCFDSDKSGDFRGYALQSYNNLLEVYPLVTIGVELCEILKKRIEDSLKGIKEAPKENPIQAVIQPPIIAEEYRYQNCISERISIPVNNIPQEGTVFYSTDGNAPSTLLDSSNCIPIQTGYDAKKRMPDTTVMIKLVAMVGQNFSVVATYPITLHYEYKWSGYTI